MIPVIDFLKHPGLNMLEPGMMVAGGSGVREVKKNSRADRGFEAHLAGSFFLSQQPPQLNQKRLKNFQLYFFIGFPKFTRPLTVADFKILLKKAEKKRSWKEILRDEGDNALKSRNIRDEIKF
jgi:hypothetical protein